MSTGGIFMASQDVSEKKNRANRKTPEQLCEFYEKKLRAVKIKQKKSARTERNAQLIVWGTAVEKMYKEMRAEGKLKLRESIEKYLTDRNLERSKNGFARLNAEA
jgi:hypothetical protein